VLKLLSLRLVTSLVALSGILSLGAYGTYSAFTDTTTDAGNSFGSGTVKITDDDAGSAIFSVAGLVPSATVQKCINVTNAGTVPFANVALSGTASGLLAPALNVVVDRGTGATGGSAGSCTGFSVAQAGIVTATLDAFPSLAAPVNDATGWGVGATKSYRISVTLDSLAGNVLQGKLANLDLAWTASS
jgi:predicted ribosomally synthesized peptide with SipW-like signal peptide